MYLPNILNPLKLVTWNSLNEGLCKVWKLEELINTVNEFAKTFSLPDGCILKTTIKKKRIKAIYEYSKHGLEFVFIPSDTDIVTLA